MKIWLRRALPGLLAMGLEVMWLGAWLRWVAAAGLPGTRSPDMLPLLVLASLAFLGVRLLLALEIELEGARAVSLALACLALLVSARATLYPWAIVPAFDPAWLPRFGRELIEGFKSPNAASLLLLTVAWLWWRGSRQAAMPSMSMRRARKAAVSAIGMLALLAMLVAATRPIDMSPWILGATVSGLAMLAATRLALVSDGYGGTPIKIGPRWLGILVVTIALVAGVALSLGSMVSPDLAREVASALEPLPRVLLRLATFVIVLFVMLWSRLAQAVAILIARILGTQRPWENEIPSFGAEAFAEDGADSSSIISQVPLWVINAVQILLLVVAIWVVARLLTRAMQRYIARRNQGEAASFESDAVAGRLADDMLELLRRAGQTLVSGMRGLVTGRGDVRGLYARMLSLMEARERSRLPAQTPFEYLPTPSSELPEASDELETLTRAYVEARYGGLEPEPSRLDALKAAWKRIRKAAGAASED